MVTQGSLIYRANQLGQQTLLGDMMKALSEAQGTKAPISRFADKVAAVFVPAVLLISVMTFGLNLVDKRRLGNRFNSCGCCVSHRLSLCVRACYTCCHNGGNGESSQCRDLV